MSKKFYSTFLFMVIALSIFAQTEEFFPEQSTTATATSEVSPLLYITLIFIVVLFLWFLWYANINLWLQAKASKVIIGTHELALMRYKGVPTKEIVGYMIKAKEAQLDLFQEDLVSLYITTEKEGDKGAIKKVVEAMIMAYNAGLRLEMKEVIKQYHAKVDIEKVIKNLVIAQNSHVTTSLKELSEFSLAHVDIHALLEIFIKAKSAHILTLTMKDLVLYQHAHLDIKKLVDAVILANDGGLIYQKPPKKEEKHDEHKDEKPRTDGHDSHGGDSHGGDSHGHEVKIDPEHEKAEKEFIKKLIEHHHSGGNILNVVNAVISAKNADRELEDPTAKLDLSLEAAKNIDLAGIDLLKAVNEAIKFKVIETEPIRAYAGDGIELTMKCRVTIRPRIRKIISGAGEETILARIHENIVTQIGLTKTHRQILESPYLLADSVEQQKKLFDDTAYDLISIDISDVEVGNDIEAKLKSLRAKADYEEERVRRLHIESEVNKAMADAFRDGTFSVKDYYKMRNMEADTSMREALSKSKKQEDTDLAI